MKNIDLSISADDTGDIDPRERVSEAIAEEVGRMAKSGRRVIRNGAPMPEPRFLREAMEAVHGGTAQIVGEAIRFSTDERREAHQERLNRRFDAAVDRMTRSWGRDFHADPLGLQQADIGQMDAGAIRQFCNAFNEESAPLSTEYDRAVSHVGRRLARQIADDIRKSMAHPGTSRPFADAFNEGWEAGVDAGLRDADPALVRMAEGWVALRRFSVVNENPRAGAESTIVVNTTDPVIFNRLETSITSILRGADPLIPRLAALLGTDDATARDWLVAKVAAFRGESEADTEARLG